MRLILGTIAQTLASMKMNNVIFLKDFLKNLHKIFLGLLQIFIFLYWIQ